MTEYRIFSDTKPSDDFVGCFPGGGGPNVECFCGRTHVAIESDFLEEETKPYYIEENKKNPDGTILLYYYDSVEYDMINGNVFVHDCPCNGMAAYEKTFWQHRKDIRKWLSIVKLRKLAEASDVGEWNEDV